MSEYRNRWPTPAEVRAHEANGGNWHIKYVEECGWDRFLSKFRELPKTWPALTITCLTVCTIDGVDEIHDVNADDEPSWITGAEAPLGTRPCSTDGDAMPWPEVQP